MTIQVDRKIYPDSCISKVVYWLSEKYTIDRHLDGDNEIISIDGVDEEERLKKIFFEQLNDYKLRGIIEEETKDIKTILYAKAFGDFDDISEEEITG